MKKVFALVLTILLGGIAVFGGVETKTDALAAESVGGAAIDVEEEAGIAGSGGANDESSANGDLAVELRTSHDAVETGGVIALIATGSTGTSIVRYEWDLNGDGVYDAVSESATFLHTFSDDGVYPAQVRVTDDHGATAESDVVELTVLNRAPVAGFSVDSGLSNDAATYEFRDASTDLDGKIVRWRWDFGDGTTSRESTSIHAFADDGTYTVTLVVIDEDGAESAPMVRTITVENTKPIASFALPADSASVGETVLFLDESVDPSPKGSIVHVGWDFGDGSYRSGGPTGDGEYKHTYTAAGIYTVTLFVIDDDGDMSSVQQLLVVT